MLPIQLYFAKDSTNDRAPLLFPLIRFSLWDPKGVLSSRLLLPLTRRRVPPQPWLVPTASWKIGVPPKKVKVEVEVEVKVKVKSS